MVDREEIAGEVRETIEVFQTGRWHIAEGEHNGLESAAQGESEDEAINALIDRFYQRAKEAEQREEERAFREEMRQTRREIAEAREERAREIEVERSTYSE